LHTGSGVSAGIAYLYKTSSPSLLVLPAKGVLQPTRIQ
jgi:hypothetical protein